MLSVDQSHLDQLTRAIYELLNGQPVRQLAVPAAHRADELGQVTEYLNRLIVEYSEVAQALAALSAGELDFDPPTGGMQMLHALKNLQTNMRHLTWKTQQIAAGDFSQRVDFMGDFSTAFNSMTQQLKEAFEQIERQRAELEEAYNDLRVEREKSEQLLLNILPARVAAELKETGATTPQAFPKVTVLLADSVDFTRRAADIEPARLIAQLSELFTAFDEIVEQYGCERIKTIGDAYLAVCGMPEPEPDHATKMIAAARAMVDYLKARPAQGLGDWPMRFGVHSGAVVGGVVGIKKYIYDVFGDTLNTASRLEQNAEPLRVNVSETTWRLVRDTYEFEERGSVEVKGKGAMKMFYLAD